MKLKLEHDEQTMSANDKLFQAIKLNNFWMIHVMLESGANLNAVNVEGFNPMEYACKLGHNKMAEFLKSKGVIK